VMSVFDRDALNFLSIWMEDTSRVPATLKSMSPIKSSSDDVRSKPAIWLFSLINPIAFTRSSLYRNAGIEQSQTRRHKQKPSMRNQFDSICLRQRGLCTEFIKRMAEVVPVQFAKFPWPIHVDPWSDLLCSPVETRELVVKEEWSLYSPKGRR